MDGYHKRISWARKYPTRPTNIVYRSPKRSDNFIIHRFDHGNGEPPNGGGYKKVYNEDDDDKRKRTPCLCDLIMNNILNSVMSTLLVIFVTCFAYHYQEDKKFRRQTNILICFYSTLVCCWIMGRNSL